MLFVRGFILYIAHSVNNICLIAQWAHRVRVPLVPFYYRVSKSTTRDLKRVPFPLESGIFKTVSAICPFLGEGEARRLPPLENEEFARVLSGRDRIVIDAQNGK